MDLNTFFSSLTEDQKCQLRQLLEADQRLHHISRFSRKKFPSGKEIQENAVNNFVCPHCKSHKIAKHGFARGIQRYRCRDCCKTFNLRTNTVFHKTKKPLTLWFDYLDLLFEQKSIRYIAKELDIAITTAFYWRHKILGVLGELTKQKKPVLGGVVEADETYLRLSFKGQKSPLPRKARRRGERAKKPGLSKGQVCVLAAVDRNKKSWIKAACLGSPKSSHIENHFQGRIKKESTLVTDKHHSYKRFCKKAAISHQQMSKFNEVRDIYHIQKVNSLHNELKSSLKCYRGVATKYLDNYIDLFEWSRRSGMNFVETFKVHTAATYSSLCFSKMTLS